MGCLVSLLSDMVYPMFSIWRKEAFVKDVRDIFAKLQPLCRALLNSNIHEHLAAKQEPRL
jgi:hypothetical protein